MCRNFLWGGNVDQRAIPIVAWDQVCLPRCEGELGVKQLKQWNKAAIGKNLWKICRGDNTLWTQWIHQTYIKDGSIWEIGIPHDCSWSLRKLLQTRVLFKQFITKKVGDGKETLLFYYLWISDQRLADKEELQDQLTSWGKFLKVSQWWDNEWRIPHSFERRFVGIAEQIKLIQLDETPDLIKWTTSSSGEFSIASAYELIRKKKHNGTGLSGMEILHQDSHLFCGSLCLID